jgi:N-acetylglucosamine kinase-like BadF-type ATPase
MVIIDVGWGHLLGDQGGAFKLAQRAVKCVLNHRDNLKPTPFDIEPIKQVIQEHFHFKGDPIDDLLHHAYEQFNKTYFASLCRKLAKLADQGDLASRHLFQLNGRDLGRHLNAVYPSVDQVRKGLKFSFF